MHTGPSKRLLPYKLWHKKIMSLTIPKFNASVDRLDLISIQNLGDHPEHTAVDAIKIREKALLVMKSDESLVNRFMDEDFHRRAFHQKYENRNFIGAMRHWLHVKNYSQDPLMVQRVLDISIQNKTYRSPGSHLLSDLLSSTPPSFYCMDSKILYKMLYFVAQYRDLVKAEEIMRKINLLAKTEQDLQRMVLSDQIQSVLLRMHVMFKDSGGVSEVLGRILDRHGSLSEDNYQILISQLDLNEAYSMLERIPWDLRLKSLQLVVSKSVDFGLIDDRLHALLINAAELDPNLKSNFWSVLACIYTNWLASRDLEEAKLCILHSKISSKNKVAINPFRCGPLAVLRITEKNFPIILRTLGYASIDCNNLEVLKWCNYEFYQLDMSRRDLYAQWTRFCKRTTLQADQISEKKIDLIKSSLR